MDTEKMRLLTRPFAKVKSRPGRNGQGIQYVEGQAIVQRLNDALCGDWSFRVLEKEFLEAEVLILGELRCGDVVKQAFGGSEITMTREGKVVSLADDCKSAATDALKKAATLLGVGLHLHLADEPSVASAPRLVPPVVGAEGQELEGPAGNRLTRKQAEFIARLAGANGQTKPELDQLAREKYGKSYTFLTVKEASEFIKELNTRAA